MKTLNLAPSILKLFRTHWQLPHSIKHSPQQYGDHNTVDTYHCTWSWGSSVSQPHDLLPEVAL